ncbi:phosphatase inhibitor-domain-containing protein [Syncephalis plumigaleata]|nr:phosphatase inhibitor-domain-containing protein [Syncephalis plumigaleata]
MVYTTSGGASTSGASQQLQERTRIRREESATSTALIPSTGVLRLAGESVPDAANDTNNTETSSTQEGVDTTSVPRRRIHWDESVVDNEHLNRRKSKICCIFRKQRAFGESSSDESSSSSCCSSSDNSDTDCDTSDKRHRHRHGRHGRRRRLNRTPSPNAYEKAPNYHKKKAQPVSSDRPTEQTIDHPTTTTTTSSSSSQ